MRNFKITITTLMMLLCITSWSQVAINLDESIADPSAMLDIKSSDRGILIPRLTSAQIAAISSPAYGLSVFNTDSNNYSFYNGSQWITLGNGFDTDWHINGDHLYSGQSGNVGIGTINPAAKLDVRGLDPDDGIIFQIGNSDLTHKLTFFGGKQSDPNPFILWKHGDPLRFTTDEGGWSEKMRISSNGDIGIGTSSPTGKLHVVSPASAYGMARFQNEDPGQNEASIAFMEGSDVVAGDIWTMGVGLWGELGDFIIGRGVERLKLDHDGNLGLGTYSIDGKSALLTNSKEGGNSKALSHRLTLANLSDDNVLRLIGPDGSFGHGAKLNFGDGDYAYIYEDLDDHIEIHTTGGLSITGSSLAVGTNGTPFYEVKQLTGTTPISSTQVLLPYPSGWFQSNTRVICLEVLFDFEGNSSYVGPGHPSLPVYYMLASNGIWIFYPAGSANQPYRLVLMMF